MKKSYPVKETQLTEPGMYLRLFHGYPTPKARQKADDWGADGPFIGPLEQFHITYGCHIKLRFVNPERAEFYGLDKNFPELGIDMRDHDGHEEGCVRFEGMNYGDMIVFHKE